MSIITEHTTVYRTSDGALFTSIPEAEKHEMALRVEKVARQCVKDSKYHPFGEYSIGSPEWEAELVRNLIKEGLAFK